MAAFFREGSETYEKKKMIAFILGIVCVFSLSGCSSSEPVKKEGLLNGIKNESEESESKESASEGSDKEDASSDSQKVNPKLIGKYTNDGYENSEFGFKITLPSSYTLESRDEPYKIIQRTESGIDVVEDANSKDKIKSISHGVTSFPGYSDVFNANDGTTFINVRLVSAKYGSDDISNTQKDHVVWESEETLVQNEAPELEETIKKNCSDYTISDFQYAIEPVYIANKKHQSAQFTYKINEIPAYGVLMIMLSEDKEYALVFDIEGSNMDSVDKFDTYFSEV